MSDMTLEPVSSSAIEAIGWADETLVVRYRGGKEYAFHGVSFDTFEAIKESSSIGRAVAHVGVLGVAL